VYDRRRDSWYRTNCLITRCTWYSLTYTSNTISVFVNQYFRSWKQSDERPWGARLSLRVLMYGVQTTPRSAGVLICSTKSTYDLLVCCVKWSCITNQRLVGKNDWIHWKLMNKINKHVWVGGTTTIPWWASWLGCVQAVAPCTHPVSPRAYPRECARTTKGVVARDSRGKSPRCTCPWTHQRTDSCRSLSK
jgi:hypothetical protein